MTLLSSLEQVMALAAERRYSPAFVNRTLRGPSITVEAVGRSKTAAPAGSVSQVTEVDLDGRNSHELRFERWRSILQTHRDDFLRVALCRVARPSRHSANMTKPE